MYDERDAVLGRPIEHLDVSTYTLNRLRWARILTFGDLVKHDARSLLMIDRFGPDSLQQVQGALAEWGLELPRIPYEHLR